MTRLKLIVLPLALALSAPALAASNPLMAAATAARADQLKLLEEVVNIDSGTGDVEGGRKVGAVFVARLKALGASVETVPAEAPGLPENIVATVKGTGKTRILMIGHLDTVFGPGTVAKWPFKIVGDRATGPGVGDEKGGVVEGIKALELLRDAKFTDFASITLLIETSEERGSPGTRKLIDRLLSTADVELNLEPGDAPDKVTVWRKSSTVVMIDVTGKAAHAGVAPQDGHNAAVELLHQLEGYAKFPHTGDQTTVNLTLLAAGTRNNIIPDHASATFSVRARTPQANDAVLAQLEANAKTIAVPGTTVKILHEPAYPPLANNPATDALAVRAGAIYAGIGRTLGTGGNGGASESAMAAAKGVPALDGLGPVGGKFHSDGEYIDLTTLTPRLYLLAALIEELGTKGVR
ncbi:M20/M25/M40 family metallo-hydrolase [Polymorphobacter sp. PAMC 29334]|uniref:glutamate carboxypeptidase n=1 Tax=Polymorphobacter sp. PAMC 29334 TaxID=2862331 RepID=UPI001C75004F|nr:glutamate carboxypeptidase [Polymorphobacter sp. PAMC 29334]QYE33960.1 M20/M25/M40 family metallo-hydrolase [Polymorphobacter sp. PAMC 29334]